MLGPATNVTADDISAWLASLRLLTNLPLETSPPGGDGEPVIANGEEIARIALPGRSAGTERSRVREAAEFLSLLSQHWIARKDLVAQTARLWKELNFLTGVATSMTIQGTREETARKLLGRIARLFGASRASILLSREDGRLVVTAAIGPGPSFHVGTVVPPGGIADRVYRTGEPILVEDTATIEEGDDVAGLLHRDASTNSFLSVPILSNGVPAGVINVTDRHSGRPFRAEDKKLIVAIAAQAGIAFDNVRLLEEARRAEAMKRELDIAATIQRALLPRGPFHVPGYEVFGMCEPAEWVGGDFFQVVERGARGLWAAVCDVSGHGISAALLMASMNAALRALISADLSPAEAARSLNDLMVVDAGGSGLYLTAALVQVDGDGRACLCSLGHPPALVQSRGGVVTAFGQGGAPAGIIEAEVYREDHLSLEPGDRLLLFTDGVTEAAGPSGAFGEERLMEWLASRPRLETAEETSFSLQAALAEHLGGRRTNDDVTFLVLHRQGRE
jgi:sigma-B regulation protein RsbU (phosphoserine phosphatase)